MRVASMHTTQENDCYGNRYTEENTPTVRGGSSRGTEEMKGGRQTRLGADISMVDLLTPNYKIRMGSWNVRTLYQEGNLQQVLREMTNCKVEILCVSETIWTTTYIEVESQSL